LLVTQLTYSSVTEDWNGSAWTEVADLATGREQHHGSGSSTSGLAFGGSTSPGVTAATEEWTAPTVNSTLTAS
jgi:hypothetical protein